MNDTGMTKHDQVLVGLVISLQAATMQHLGKVKNPLTDAVERDLEQARATIDILEMLKAKCRSETPADVLGLLDDAVMSLQMNYLDELRRESGPGEGATEPPSEADTGTASETEAAAAPDPQEEDPAAEESGGNGEERSSS